MSNGTRTLAHAVASTVSPSEARPQPQPRLTEAWHTRQAGALRAAAKEAKDTAAALAKRRAAIEERHRERERSILRRHRTDSSADARAELHIARRARAEALHAATAEAQRRLRDLSADAAAQVEAAARHHRTHGSRFAVLRASRHTRGGRQLDEVEAEQLRAAALAVAREAGREELRGMVEQARADGDHVRLHALVVALDRRRPEDRPLSGAELVAAVELPEADEAAATLDSVLGPAEALADAWRGILRGDELRPGDGLRDLSRALGGRDPAGRAGAVAEELAKLAAFEPDAEAEADDPPEDGRSTIASALTGDAGPDAA